MNKGLNEFAKNAMAARDRTVEAARLEGLLGPGATIGSSRKLKIEPLKGKKSPHMGRSVFLQCKERDIDGEHVPRRFETEILIFINPAYNRQAFEDSISLACSKFFDMKPAPGRLDLIRRMARDVEREAGKVIHYSVTDTRRAEGVFDSYEIIIGHPHSLRYRAEDVYDPFMRTLTDCLVSVGLA